MGYKTDYYINSTIFWVLTLSINVFFQIIHILIVGITRFKKDLTSKVTKEDFSFCLSRLKNRMLYEIEV